MCILTLLEKHVFFICFSLLLFWMTVGKALFSSTRVTCRSSVVHKHFFFSRCVCSAAVFLLLFFLVLIDLLLVLSGSELGFRSGRLILLPGRLYIWPPSSPPLRNPSFSLSFPRDSQALHPLHPTPGSPPLQPISPSPPSHPLYLLPPPFFGVSDLLLVF